MRTIISAAPPLLPDHVDLLTVEGTRHNFLSLINPAISRMAWKLPCCSYLLLFRATMASWCLASQAQRPWLFWWLCSNRYSLHHMHPPRSSRAGLLVSHFLAADPLPNSIPRWTLSRVCGTPSTEKRASLCCGPPNRPNTQLTHGTLQPASASSISEQCHN